MGAPLRTGPQSPGRVAQSVMGVVPVRQGLGFDPQLGHTQEAANECVNKGSKNNKDLGLRDSAPSGGWPWGLGRDLGPEAKPCQ